LSAYLILISMNVYLIVSIIFCVETFLTIKNVKYALPIVLFTMLLIPATVKFNVGINLNVFNVVVAIFFAFTFLLKKNRTFNLPRFRAIIVIYAFYVCITSYLTFGMTVPFSVYISNIITFILAFIALPFALTYIKLDERSIRYFDWVVLGGGTIIIIYGIFNYITAFNPYIAYITLATNSDIDMSNVFQEEERGFIKGRVSSTFIHPLQLGQCALLLFSYSFYRIKKHVHKALFISFMLGLILMCVLCGSRSAIFPMLMVPLIYLFHAKRSRMVKYLLGIVLLVFISYPMLPRQARSSIEGLVFVWDQKAANRAGISGSSIDGRTEQLKAAFHIVKANPLFGKGEGYVNEYGFRHPEMYGYESIVLRYIVEGGIIGLMMFLIFYFSSYKILLSFCKTNNEKGEVRSLCFSFFVSIVLTGISYSFYTLYMIFYFVMLYNLINDHLKQRLINENSSYHPQLQ